MNSVRHKILVGPAGRAPPMWPPSLPAPMIQLPLNGATSGFVLEYKPAGFGYQTHTCIVVRLGCQKLKLGPRVRSLLRACRRVPVHDERAVLVMAGGGEEAERRVRQRRCLRHRREYPLKGAELPGVLPGVLVDQDRRLTDVEPLDLWVYEVKTHVRHHHGEDLVAVGLGPAQVRGVFGQLCPEECLSLPGGCLD